MKSRLVKLKDCLKACLCTEILYVPKQNMGLSHISFGAENAIGAVLKLKRKLASAWCCL